MIFDRYYGVVLLLFAGLFAHAQPTQILDNFSDGDFSQNPAWTGDTGNFVVNAAGELQLMAPAAGTSSLFTQGTIPDSNVWDLRFRMEFSPSTSNLLRIVLWSSSADLTTANAYWLEIGENGTADALRLFRVDAGAKKLVATGVAGLVGTDPVNIHLRMQRNSAGLWTLDAAANNDPLAPQFSISDATYKGGANAYFGFQCVYTETRKESFFFDDIQLNGFVIADTQAPLVLSAAPQDAQHILVVFNEKMDAASAENVSNYSLNNGIGNPQSAGLQADGQGVLLTLNSGLPTGSYTLSISGAKDLAGNAVQTQSINFSYFAVQAAGEFDLIFNEIMADPTPANGLPEFEWIEVYNRSSKYIQMSSIRIQDGTSLAAPLTDYVAAPGEYMVLVTKINADSMRKAIGGTVLGMSLSSISLNNDGDVLTLSDASGNIIDRVSYRIDWHTVGGKDDGGWSLERINPETPCVGKENWQSCPLNPGPGGTPGKKNASFNDEPDESNPEFVLAVPFDPSTLVLHFSEGLNVSAQNTTLYSLVPAIAINSATLNPDNRAEILLHLATPLQTGTVYDLNIEQLVADCSDNPLLESVQVPIGLPEKPAPGDIAINEILYNPPTGGVRYIEFYNKSNKIFNWSEFSIGNFMAGPDFTDIDVEAVSAFRLLLPGAYDVLTPGREDVAFRYKNINENNLIFQTFPSFNDKKGNITLFWSKGGTVITIDSFNYKDEYHNALYSVSDRDGVALERISVESPTNVASNWTSAATLKTGAAGTPTLPNSQSFNSGAANPGDDLIFLPSARLSPFEQDGKEDFLDIQYKLPREGFAATLNIYDSDGIPVKRLVRQQLIGVEGHLRWDGDNADGTLARPGIYILFMEIYHPDGTVSQVKKTISMVRQW